MAITVQIEGLQELQNNLNRRIKNIDKASKKGIKKAALLVLDKSIQKAPILTGDLRRSGTIDDTQLQSQGFIDVGYNTPYALRQHEEFPNKSDPAAEWKYLENPFKESQDKIIEIIENETRKEVDRNDT